MGKKIQNIFIKECKQNFTIFFFNRYDMMRVDPQLMFLKICGPPDEDEMIAAQAKPMNKINATDLDQDENSKADDDDDSLMSGSKTPSERASSVKPSDAKDETTNGQFKPWPASSELNGRLRRLIGNIQF